MRRRGLATWLSTAALLAAGCRQILGIEDGEARGIDASPAGDATHAADADPGPALSWSEAAPGTRPEPRAEPAMAFDPVRERVVLFGGYQQDIEPLGDTWLWNGSTWTDATPEETAASPEPRDGAAMSYDSGDELVVLFGGTAEGITEVGDTWAWDGESWTDVTPEEGSPQPRTGHAMAYDAARELVVLFGGFGEQRLGDTWTWDGESWTDVTPEEGSPQPRTGHAMAYDAARGRVVLFGGFLGDDDHRDETWEWDGGRWTEIRPDGGAPRARSTSMVYDPLRERVVLFGGLGARDYEDTWAWDGRVWTRLSDGEGAPTRRHAHGLAYDFVRDEVVLFGGRQDAFVLFDDTWLARSP